MILGRIADELFDDVVPCTAPPPAERKDEDEDPEAGLDTKKSRVGLGDLYADLYEKQVLGAVDEEESKEKVEAKRQFAKVMYALDLLTNQHFTPKPVTASKAGDLGDVAAIKMEDTIPLMMSTAAQASAKEVRRPQKSDKA